MGTGSHKLHAIVLSVSNLDESLNFFCSVIGYRSVAKDHWSGKSFEDLWRLPRGQSANVALLEVNGLPHGRLLLIEFASKERRVIRERNMASFIGHNNINLYVDNIHEAVKKLKQKGFHFWGDPVAQKMGGGIGDPIEVVFDGPDNLPINLVELPKDGGATVTGKSRLALESLGLSETGYSPVATTSQYTLSLEKTVAFYKDVLGYEIKIDSVMGNTETNTLLGWPADGKVRINFLDQGHLYGKIGIAEPQNFSVPDITPNAHAPNIGYLAQVFIVDSLEQAQHGLSQNDLSQATRIHNIDYPGVGFCDVLSLPCPGSRALIHLIQKQT